MQVEVCSLKGVLHEEQVDAVFQHVAQVPSHSMHLPSKPSRSPGQIETH